MGTNYYFEEATDYCGVCGRYDSVSRLHIGKSSGGWCFAVRLHPEEGINSLDDWKERFKYGAITDEYGRRLSEEEMILMITRRASGQEWEGRSWFGGSEEAFHRSNYSERGPNGLLRAQLGGRCVGHGEGTWDYFVGEFS